MKKLVNNTKHFIDQHSQTILSGMAVVGLCTTVVMAYKSGPRIQQILEEEEEKGSSKKEKLIAVAPELAPTLIMAGATTACIIGSTSISNKKIAALSAAYSLAEAGTKQWIEKTRELAGEKTVEKIHDKICEEKVAVNPPAILNQEEFNGNEIIASTGHGNTLCYDVNSGQYFRSSPEYIKITLAKLSKRLASEGYVTLNDVYEELGMNRTKYGENFGFHSDSLADSDIEPWFSSTTTENDYPVLVVDYKCEPIWLH